MSRGSMESYAGDVGQETVVWITGRQRKTNPHHTVGEI
jgi:hypothetical protein